MKKIKWLIVCFSLLLLLTGCATSKLWSEANHDIYEASAVATGLEIYGESPTLLTRYDYPKVGISYTAPRAVIADNFSPPSREGCIILKRFDDSSRFLVGLESLLRAIPRSKIKFVKAVISHRPPRPGYGPDEWYNVRLGVAIQSSAGDDLLDETGKRKIDSRWIPFLKGSPADGYARTAQLSLEYRYSLPLDLFVITDNIEEDTLYLFFGGPSGGGPSGSAHLEFVNECGVKEDFIPLLGDDSIPFTIQFVEGERAMEYPLGARIVMTPFTVAFDVVTFPVQALLVVTLGRIGY